MIEKAKIGSTEIFYAPIIGTDATNRREAERQAINHIIRHRLGPNAHLTHNQDGAPIIEGINISISHSRKFAVVAFDTESAIGIDAEEWRPALERTKKRFLTENELLWCTSSQQLLTAWTIKEAIYKIEGIAAYSFDTAIHISPGMTEAHTDNGAYNISKIHIEDTIISLAQQARTPTK